MKLRNKKTGEILGDLGSFIIQNPNHINCEAITKYDSLAELNEEWEDVPEPKEDGLDNIIALVEAYSSRDSERYPKEIVKKLKAWQRLKDKGFEFYPVDRYESLCGNGFNIPITATMPPEAYTDVEVSKDLDLLFGGEE